MGGEVPLDLIDTPNHNPIMGVNGLLPRILPSAGRENYDLSALADGMMISTSPQSVDDDGNQAASSNDEEPPAKRRRRGCSSWTRRKFRIAVDVNGWISRAAHGYGGSLMDERHLSYHGRAELRNAQLQQQQRESGDGQTNNRNNDRQRLQYISKCVSFVLQRIEFLRDECSALVLPVLDGATPPCKRDAVRERSNRRRRAMEQRDEVGAAQSQPRARGANDDDDDADVDEGDEAARTEAEVLRRISASKRAGTGKDYSLRRAMLGELLGEFRKRGWPFIVAPYEADGQLAYLANSDAVDLVVTEDSDLIALGVPTLVYRLGGWNGSNAANRSGNVWGSSSSLGNDHLRGTLLRRTDLGSSHGIDLTDFSDAMLACMFVAAGCDYCDSLKGIGVVTARNIVKKAFHGGEANEVVRARPEEPALKAILNELFRSCHKDAREQLLPLDDPEKEEVRLAYERSFLAAIAMYRHPLVYDPISSLHMIANDVCDNENNTTPAVSAAFMRDERILMEYEPYRDLITSRERLHQVIGAPFAPETARDIAEGLVDPRQLPEPDGPTTEGGTSRDNNEGDSNENNEENADENDQQQEAEDDDEAEKSGDPLTQESSSGGLQLSTQDSQGGGAGTQQTKSSSSSGLSPDLLASSPTPQS